MRQVARIAQVASIRASHPSLPFLMVDGGISEVRAVIENKSQCMNRGSDALARRVCCDAARHNLQPPRESCSTWRASQATAKLAASAGANVLVAGSAIFGPEAPSMPMAIAKLEAALLGHGE